MFSLKTNHEGWEHICAGTRVGEVTVMLQSNNAKPRGKTPILTHLCLEKKKRL